MTLAAFSFTDAWRPLVEVGTGDTRAPIAAARWDVDNWDAPTSLWSGIEPLWEDVSCFVTSARWAGGRNYAVDRFTPASGSVEVLNVDGWASQLRPNHLDVRPGRQIRIGVVDAATGTRHGLFRGYLDATNPSYPPPSESTDRVTFQIIDALGEIGLGQSIPLPAPVGVGERGDQRFQRILDRYSWPAQRTGPVDGSSVQMDGTVHDLGVVDELGRLTESEGGGILATEDGNLVFRNRNWYVWPASTPIDATIGNTHGEVCPAEWLVTRSRADGTIINRAIVGRGGADPQQFDDLASQHDFGVLPWERTDLNVLHDGDLEVIGRRVLKTRASGVARIGSVRLSANRYPLDVIPLAVAAQLWASPPRRYRCHHVESWGTEFDTLQVLQSIDHELTRDRWQITLGFDNAAPFVLPAARWDAAYWDTDPWGQAVA